MAQKIKNWFPNLGVAVLGMLLTIVGVMAAVPGDWWPFVAIAAGLLLATGSILIVIMSVQSEKSLRAVELRVAEKLDWSWMLDANTGWEEACAIAQGAIADGTSCYETSSIANNDKYESSIIALAGAWRVAPQPTREFTRIFCFDNASNDPQDLKCRGLFHQMLDSTQDPKGDYDDLRQCIVEGNMKILHLPYRLLADYLAVRTEDGRHNCLFSLAPPVGQRFLISGRVRGGEAARKLFGHVAYIRDLATKHCNGDETGVAAEVGCCRYKFSQRRNTLLPKGSSLE